jgi:hypothetical protein
MVETSCVARKLLCRTKTKFAAGSYIAAGLRHAGLIPSMPSSPSLALLRVCRGNAEATIEPSNRYMSRPTRGGGAQWCDGFTVTCAANKGGEERLKLRLYEPTHWLEQARNPGASTTCLQSSIFHLQLLEDPCSHEILSVPIVAPVAC